MVLKKSWKVIEPTNGSTDLHIYEEYTEKEKQKYPYSQGIWLASVRNYHKDKQQENARLIAAAPDMYKVLKDVERVLGDVFETSNDDHQPQLVPILMKVQRAISKAEGMDDEESRSARPDVHERV
ncbi:hypothetical protein [Desertibacillus haloalkaliphilus]|uniref:hypothetical protein n=1 Tax=Desertibacillus haloalkaliphilus TaxID=1328930 RepID=UPI001C266E56|nr:hypothetical protein [Desertibacillus haloalkaliphilus]MBU8908538.1 hypothetical protein [Desertibacillus haloalkaliphilus]